MKNILLFLIPLLTVFIQLHLFAQIDDITRLPVKNITAKVQEIVNNNFDPNAQSVGNDPVSGSDYYLHQNFSNSFNPATVITYRIPQQGFVTLKIFDVLGKEVATLLNEEKPTESYDVDFFAKGLASGVYIYRMKVNDPESSSGQAFITSK